MQQKIKTFNPRKLNKHTCVIIKLIEYRFKPTFANTSFTKMSPNQPSSLLLLVCQIVERKHCQRTSVLCNLIHRNLLGQVVCASMILSLSLQVIHVQSVEEKKISFLFSRVNFDLLRICNRIVFFFFLLRVLVLQARLEELFFSLSLLMNVKSCQVK